MTKETINWIKQKFNNNFNVQTRTLLKVIPKDILIELEEELLEIPEYQNIKHIIMCIIMNSELKKCATCGKLLTYRQSFITKNQYCSSQCINKQQVNEKQKKYFLQKYGVANISQVPEIKEKKKQTSLSHYGVENVFQSKEVQEKQKKTCIEKYGVMHVFQSKELREKSKRTCLKKYGVEYASQNEQIKEKIIHTNLQKYGTKSPSQNEQVKQKMKYTCLEKYGVKNIFLDKRFIDKNLKRNYQSIKEKWKDYIIPLFTENEYNGHKQEYRWKCVKCGNEFEQRIYNTSHLKKIGEQIPRCLKCYPLSQNSSFLEKEVVNFVKMIYQGEIIENDRKLITPYELDIVIPKKHFAIEFDGLFWHSENSGKNSQYHLNKTKLCEDKGYQLIHIFEDEWINQRQIIEDRIKSLLGIYDRKIYARKCEIREIEKTVSDIFLLENHLQGKDNSSIRYGLYYDNELVSVMTFGKPRFNKKYDFELIRFASKLGTQVIGGFSKLLKYFEKEHQGKSIISYADRRFSKGNVYEKSRFTLMTISKPNYIWVNKDNRLSRYQCQKHKLKQILGEKFNPNLSESENMLLNGYSRVYDCGNLVFVKEKHN